MAIPPVHVAERRKRNEPETRGKLVNQNPRHRSTSRKSANGTSLWKQRFVPWVRSYLDLINSPTEGFLDTTSPMVSNKDSVPGERIMAWIDGIFETWDNRLTTRQVETYRQQPKDRRTLDENDLLSFQTATEQRKPALEVTDVQTWLKRQNPWRWSSLQREIKWMRKKMVKLGLNPDDAGWYL